MATIVNNFSIIENGSQIALDVETLPGYNITSIRFWSMNTFKDYSLAIDGSYKISGVSNKEVLIYTAAELSAEILTDIWFVEVTDNVPESECSTCGEPVLAITYNLLEYYACSLNEFLKVRTDSGCKSGLNTNLVTYINLLIDSVIKDIELGFYSDAIDNVGILKKMCNLGNGCTSCKNIKCSSCGGFKQV